MAITHIFKPTKKFTEQLKSIPLQAEITPVYTNSQIIAVNKKVSDFTKEQVIINGHCLPVGRAFNDVLMQFFHNAG